jgi:hypothetical protein
MLLAGSSAPAWAQQATLPMDAEFNGALLTGGQAVTFDPMSGWVNSGLLKADYIHGAYVFAAGTAIEFYDNGEVLSGTTKNEVTSGNFVFPAGKLTFHSSGRISSGVVKAGGGDADILLPVQGVVSLDADGRVTVFNPSSSAPYRLLDHTLMMTVGLTYDRSAQRYLLKSGKVVNPQIVARFNKPNASGLGTPTPIIVPAGSSFQFHNREGSPPEEFSAQWFVTGFTLNGINFGPTPSVWIRDMKLVYVQVSTAVVIDGVQYRAGERVQFDLGGRIVKPEP